MVALFSFNTGVREERRKLIERYIFDASDCTDVNAIHIIQLENIACTGKMSWWLRTFVLSEYLSLITSTHM